MKINDVLLEFAPGRGGESGRWYTDDQMTDIVGDGWWQDLDISEAVSKQAMIQEAQAWLDDQGYSVQVLNVKVNDDDCDWFIQGSFDNPGFANEDSLNEFAPAGSGGGNTPRGPRTPGGDDGSGDDPYSRPEPESYRRSIDFFGRFEADHFDDEVFDKATGEFRGYWDDQEGRDQIAYFKFDNPQRTGDDDPGMGWYYEPQNESAAGDDQLNEILPALAAGAGALARGAAAAGRMAAPTLRKVPGAVKTVGQAVSRVPGAVEKVAIQGLELLNDKVPGGIFNPDGSLKGSQYLTKYLSPQEIQQVQQHQKQGMAEGNDDDYGPELDALKKEFGKFTTHYDRMDTDPAYAASYNRQQADRLNRERPDDDLAADTTMDMGQDMAEGQQMGEYGRVLSALGMYVPDKFSMEELNTPDWHRVIANKADVPVEYAGKVIDDFTRPVDGHDDEEWPEDDEQGVAEAPGAETLAHNQSTVASNEKAFDLEEGKPREKEADYGADYQDMVARVKKLAGLGPLKTVYDPQKRVYKNVPVAVQPKK
jgi:hypothetical protein